MLDDRIDEVARELTTGEPGGEFRARVFAKIDREGGHGRRGWKWVLAPVGVAVGILIAVFGSQVDRQLPSGETRLSADIRLPFPRSASVPRTNPAHRTERVNAVNPVVSVSLANIPDPVDPVRIEPLEIEAVNVPALTPAGSIEADGLSITSIDVAPLDANEQQ